MNDEFKSEIRNRKRNIEKQQRIIHPSSFIPQQIADKGFEPLTF
jgi:hypothetical protein